MQDVPDQLAQTFVMKNAPGGCNRTGVEYTPALGAFPVDHLCNRILITHSRLVTFRIEVEDLALMVAAERPLLSHRVRQVLP